MPNEVLYITFIAMVAVIMVNIVCAVDHKKAEKDCKRWEAIYYDFVIRSKKSFGSTWVHTKPRKKDSFILTLKA